MLTHIRPSGARNHLKVFLTLLTVMAVLVCTCFSHAVAAEQDIASGTSGSCTWTIDADGKLTFSPSSGDTGTLGSWNGYTTTPWYNNRKAIKTVEFQGTVKAVRLYAMFFDCANLVSIDFNGFDISSSNNMSEMFHGCSSLATIDLSPLDTSKVNNMYQTFSGCSSLTSIDTSVCNLSLVSDLEGTFGNCTNLTAIDLTGFAGAPVKKMARMFNSCNKLEAIDLSALDCSNLQTVDTAFCGCYSVESLDLTGFNTAQVSNMSLLFAYCQSLNDLNISSFDTSNVTNMTNMFQECRALTSLDLSHFDTSNVTTLQLMFDGCRSMKTLNLTSFDTRNVTNMDRTFDSCWTLERIYVSDKWTTEGLSEPVEMFRYSTALVGANGTAFSPEHVDSEYARIDTADTPGYFWPAPDDGDTPGDNPGDDPDNPDDPDDPGTDPDDPSDPGTDPDNPDDPGDNSGSSDNPGGPGSSTGDPSDGSDSGTSTNTSTTETAKSIAKSNVTLSKSSFSFNGKKRTPKATVTLAGKTLVKGRDYAVSYSKGRKKIGTYKVTIKGKGSYKGSVTLTFKIVPAKSKVKKLVAHKNSDGSSGFIASWKRVGKRGAYGYELRWAPVKSFKKAASVKFKRSSKFAKSASAPLLVRNKSWRGKTVYVQVRTWTKVKGKTYASAWSSAKKIKVKK